MDGREREFSLLLGSDDRLACQLVRVLTEKQVRIPEEVSVVGWNNSRFLQYLTPPLASVSIPMEKIGREAAGIILANLNGGADIRKKYVPEEIVFRKSFAPVGCDNACAK